MKAMKAMEAMKAMKLGRRAKREIKAAEEAMKSATSKKAMKSAKGAMKAMKSAKMKAMKSALQGAMEVMESTTGSDTDDEFELGTWTVHVVKTRRERETQYESILDRHGQISMAVVHQIRPGGRPYHEIGTNTSTQRYPRLRFYFSAARPERYSDFRRAYWRCKVNGESVRLSDDDADVGGVGGADANRRRRPSDARADSREGCVAAVFSHASLDRLAEEKPALAMAVLSRMAAAATARRRRALADVLGEDAPRVRRK